MADPVEPKRKDAHEETSEIAPLPTRRALIAATAALVTGALSKASERSAEAAVGDPLLTDTENFAQGTTDLTRFNQLPGEAIGPALRVHAVDGGSALMGVASLGGTTITADLSVGAGVAAMGLGVSGLLAGTGDDPFLLRQGMEAASGFGAGLVAVNTDFAHHPVLVAFRPGPVVTMTAQQPIDVGVQSLVAFPAQAASAVGVQAIVGDLRSDPLAVTMTGAVGFQAFVGTFAPDLTPIPLPGPVGVQAVVGSFTAEPTAVGIQGIVGDFLSGPPAVTMTADVPVAVQGLALDPTGLGGFFANLQGGTGLRVLGDVEVQGALRVTGGGAPAVSTGIGVIPKGSSFFDVADAAVNQNSFVAVTLTSNPKTTRLGFVTTFSGGFRINLKPKTPPIAIDTTFMYVVIS